MAAKQVHGPSRTTREIAKQVLGDFRDQFIADVDANKVVWELLHKNIIPRGIQENISKTDEPKQQNEILHDCLQRTCTKEALMEVCDIIVSVRGHPKMRELGEAIKRRLHTDFQSVPQPADADGKAEAEAVEPVAIEPEANEKAYPEEEMRLWKFINGVFYQLGQECPIFGILVIGETGTGKSTLINNLLGREVAVVGHSMESETQLVTPHERSVEGVPVVVYDTPGLDDTSGDDDPKHLEIMKSLLDRKKIHLVIYCIKLTENRMRRGLIRTFQEYHKIGVPWKQTVVTLTFADIIVVETTKRISMMRQQLKKTLVERVGVTSSVVHGLKICPTAKDCTEALPNGKQWYVPFWLDVVEVLVPAALAQFLYIHKYNIHMEGTPASKHPNPVNITLVGEDQERFQREMDRLPKLHTATTGQFSASEFLKKYETKFFEAINPRLSLLRLVRKGVIPEDVVSVINTSATMDAREVLYHHLTHYATVDALKKYCEAAIDAEGYPKMQSLGRKMMEELQQGAVSSTPLSSITQSTQAKTSVCPPNNRPTPAEFLDHFRQQFIAEVDASAIVLELESQGIISYEDQKTIRQEMNATLQAQLLHACLKKTCDAKALMDVCDIIATVKGNPRMKSFGEHMKTEWMKDVN